MNKLLILGGGFGVYGYLPAAISKGWEVTTLEEYFEFIRDRPELRKYLSDLKFVREKEVKLDSFQGVVMARTPLRQQEFLRANLSYEGHFFLEKPLGIDVDSHMETLKLLESCRSTFTVAYLFRYQEWYREAIKANNKNKSIDIHWGLARSPKFSWKGDVALGGGLVSYFGIHLLSLLADLGYCADSLKASVNHSSLQLESLATSKPLRFSLEFSEIPSFKVTLENESWHLNTPFGGNPIPGEVDPRVTTLANYLGEGIAKNSSTDQIDHEYKVLNLSRAIEQIL